MPVSKDATAALLKVMTACCKPLAAAVLRRESSIAPTELNVRVRRGIESLLVARICQILELPSVFASSSTLEAGLEDENLVDSPIDDSVIHEIDAYLRRCLVATSGVGCAIELLGLIHQRLMDLEIEMDERRGVTIRRSTGLRRNGGIYYTPEFVVDYMVKSTLEVWLKNKAPADVAKLRILDPACGSGAFLCAAYRKLLNWYARFEGMQTHRRPTCANPAISLGRRLEILRANIFGVDIDSDAARLTRFALVLEACRDVEMPTDFPEKFESDLASNILAGDSLNGPAFGINHGDSPPRDSVSNGNTILWRAAFPTIAASNGFDMVIGNPPYRRELDNKANNDTTNTELGQKYRTARMDLWYLFLHRGLELLKPNGTLSFITPAYWTNGTGANKLIEELSASTHVDEIFHLGKAKVFDRVRGQHTIIRLTRSHDDTPTRVRLIPGPNAGTAEPFLAGDLPVQEFLKTKQQLFRGNGLDLQPPCDDLLRKIERGIPLSKLGIVRQGIAENPATINKKTNARFGERWKTGQGVFSLTNEELAKLNLSNHERTLVHNYHELSDLGRYFLASRPSRRLIYSTRRTCPDIAEFPAVRDHLNPFRCIMQARRETRNGNNEWWHLHWPRDESLWTAPKIISVQMGQRPQFVAAEKSAYVPFSTNVWIPSDRSCENLHFVTAILNSKLAWKWFQHHAKRRGVGLEINGAVLSQMPIPLMDSSVNKSKAIELAELGKTRHRLANQNGEATGATSVTPSEIAQFERQIDRAVYDLYGLDENQIEIVETATKLP